MFATHRVTFLVFTTLCCVRVLGACGGVGRDAGFAAGCGVLGEGCEVVIMHHSTEGGVARHSGQTARVLAKEQRTVC